MKNWNKKLQLSLSIPTHFFLVFPEKKSNISNLHQIVHNWTWNFSNLPLHKSTDLYKFRIKKHVENKITNLMKMLFTRQGKNEARRKKNFLGWLFSCCLLFLLILRRWSGAGSIQILFTYLIKSYDARELFHIT